MDKRERIRAFGEVFTPDRVVKDMCDMLEAENPEADVFAPWTTFLEPTCGDGAFIVEILKRKFQRCVFRTDYTIAIGSVYGMDIQADNVEATIRRVTELCGQYVKLTKGELQTINDHYIMCDSLKVMRMMNDAQLYRRVAAGEPQEFAAGAGDVSAVAGAE